MAATSADLARKFGAALGLDETKGRAALQAVVQSVHALARLGKSVDLPGIGVFECGGEGAPAAGLAEELAAQRSDLAESAPAVLRTLADLLRVELLQPQSVQIDGLGLFDVRRSAPRLEHRDGRNRLVQPPRASFAFTPAPPLTQAADDKPPAFRPSPDVEQILAALASTTLLIAVPAPDFFCDTLEYYFGKNGWSPRIVTSVADALALIHTGGAYAVVLDTALQDSGKLVQTLRGRRETSHLPLVLLQPMGFPAECPPAFMIAGDAQLIQPFEVRELITTVDTQLMRAAEEAAIFQHQVTFLFPSEEEQVEFAYDFGHKLFEQSGLPEEGQVALAAAFREAVGNAVQHGNKYRKDRKVEVLYLLDREKITIVVKDSGQGFDHRRYVHLGRAGDALTAARERGREGKMGGLGIMLMLKCCDKVEYNTSGNAITLTKSVRPKPAAAGHAPVTAAPAAARR